MPLSLFDSRQGFLSPLAECLCAAREQRVRIVGERSRSRSCLEEARQELSQLPFCFRALARLHIPSALSPSSCSAKETRSHWEGGMAGMCAGDGRAEPSESCWESRAAVPEKSRGKRREERKERSESGDRREIEWRGEERNAHRLVCCCLRWASVAATASNSSSGEEGEKFAAAVAAARPSPPLLLSPLSMSP